MDTEALKIRKWADTGDRTDPDSSTLNPALNRAVGWTAEFSRESGHTPRRGVMNQLLRELTGFAVDVREHGVLEWSALQDYEIGAIVQHNGQLWRVGSRNGPSTLVVEPGTDTNVWATTARTVSPPAAPPNPSGTAGQGRVTWNWGCPLDNGAIISRFEYQTRVSGEAWGAVTQTTSPFLLQTSLTNGTTYQFRIRAVNSQGHSDWSTTASATPAATIPGRVIGVVGFGGEDDLEIHWAEPDEGGSSITGYVVQWRTTNGIFTTQNQAQVTSTGYTVENLTHSTGYEFRVRAVNGEGNGLWSDVVSESTTAEYVAPIEPPATPGAPDSVPGIYNIVWRWQPGLDNGASITSYDVEWRVLGDSWTAAQRISTNYSYWDQRNLSHSTNYQVRIRAVNSAGVSDWSTTGAASTASLASASTPDALPAPSVKICAVGGTTEVVWSWSLPSEDVTGFDFQWRISGQAWSGNIQSVTGTVAIISFPNDTDTIEGRVRATNTAGNGAWSPTTGADPADATTSPFPAGTIIDFAGSTVPTGYLECDGSAVSRTTYSRLYSAIGDTWGDGDGSTTFNLPNFQRRTAIGKGGSSSSVIRNTLGSTGGSETHTLVESELPSHQHYAGGETRSFGGGNHNHDRGTLSISQNAPHAHSYDISHRYSDSEVTRSNSGTWVSVPSTARAQTRDAGAHTHTISGKTGQSGTHDHLVIGATAPIGGGGSHINMQPSAVILKAIKT